MSSKSGHIDGFHRHSLNSCAYLVEFNGNQFLLPIDMDINEMKHKERTL